MQMNEAELEQEFYARYNEWQKKLEAEFKVLSDRKLVIMAPVFFSFKKEIEDED